MDEQQYEYRTGKTDPEKSSRGLVAGLLICVIFLCGLVSALSFMNIHLFRALKNTRENPPLSFSQGEATQSAEDSLLLAGMALQEPDPVYQQLHDLPEGLYVAQVEADSQAEKLGIAPGDVLIALETTPVTTLEEMRNLLDTHVATQFTLFFSRDGKEFSLTLSL